MSEAVRVLRAQYDERHGGFGRAPKFPPASALEFLLRAGALDLVRGTLDGMAAGGMYDLVGGGFHRYSVDEQWLVPHFEKMLYDNALLVPAYLHGWLVTGEERYRRVVEQTVEYALRELRLDGGGFASAQDADTDGVEGLTFTWTPEEIDRRELLLPFEHGQYILRGELSDDERARLLATTRRNDRSRHATTRRSPAGTGSCSRRSPKRGGGSTATTGSTPRASSRSSCSARSPTASACTARGVTASPRARAISRTTRTSRTACTSCTSRPATRAGCTSRTGSRSSRSSSSRTT